MGWMVKPEERGARGGQQKLPPVLGAAENVLLTENIKI
jgi:hypothetical protein